MNPAPWKRPSAPCRASCGRCSSHFPGDRLKTLRPLRRVYRTPAAWAALSLSFVARLFAGCVGVHGKTKLGTMLSFVGKRESEAPAEPLFDSAGAALRLGGSLALPSRDTPFGFSDKAWCEAL